MLCVRYSDTGYSIDEQNAILVSKLSYCSNCIFGDFCSLFLHHFLQICCINYTTVVNHVIFATVVYGDLCFLLTVVQLF